METIQSPTPVSSNHPSCVTDESLHSAEDITSSSSPRSQVLPIRCRPSLSECQPTKLDNDAPNMRGLTESDDHVSLSTITSDTASSSVKTARKPRQYITKFITTPQLFIQIPHFRVTENWNHIAESWIKEMIRANPHARNHWTVDLIVQTGHWYLHGSTSLNHRQRTYAMNGLVARRENGCIARIIDEATAHDRQRPTSPPPVVGTTQLPSQASIVSCDTSPPVWTPKKSQQVEVFDAALESSEPIHYSSTALDPIAQPEISKAILPPFVPSESTIEFHERPESVTSTTNHTDDCLSTPPTHSPELYRTFIPPQNPTKVTHVPISCSWCGKWDDHYVSTCPDYPWDNSQQKTWSVANRDQYVDASSTNDPLSKHVPLSNVGTVHPGTFEYFHKFGFPVPDDRFAFYDGLSSARDESCFVGNRSLRLPGEAKDGSVEATDGSTQTPVSSVPKLNPDAPCFVFKPKIPTPSNADCTAKTTPSKPRWADIASKTIVVPPIKANSGNKVSTSQDAPGQNKEPPRIDQPPPKKLWSSILRVDESPRAKVCLTQKPSSIPGTELSVTAQHAWPTTPSPPKRGTEATRTMKTFAPRTNTLLKNRQLYDDARDQIPCDVVPKTTDDASNWTVVEPQSEKDKVRGYKFKSKRLGRSKDYLKDSWRP